MKAHIGVDADSDLVHTVIGTSGNVADVTEGNSLLHGEEADAFGDAGYQGAHKRPDASKGVTWHVAMRPGKRKELDKENNPTELFRTFLEPQNLMYPAPAAIKKPPHSAVGRWSGKGGARLASQQG